MSLAYSLTDLTGQRKNTHRYMVVMTFEVRRHTLIVSLIGLVASLVPALILSMLVGPLGFGILAIGIPVANLLFGARQRKGLRVYRYESLLNSKKAARGFWINGQPFAKPMFIMHQPTVVDIAPLQREDGPHAIRGSRDRSYTSETIGVRDRA